MLKFNFPLPCVPVTSPEIWRL